MIVTLFNDILLTSNVGSASGVLPVRGALLIAMFISSLPASALAEGLSLPTLQKTSSPGPSHPNQDGQGNFRSPALVKRQAVTGLAARARLEEDRALHHFSLRGGC